MKTFQELGLKKEIVLALSAIKLNVADKLQEKVIPLILKCRNVAFTSNLGSSKTLAYTLGFLGKLDRKKSIQILIITPTKESCIQIGKDLEKVCTQLQINFGLLYGGRDVIGDYRTIMKKNQIIVGTPERLIKHINDKKIRVGEVSCLVFDESDQIFNYGYYDDCAYIKSRVSSIAQVLLSCTAISEKVERFLQEEIGDFEIVT